MLPQQLLPTLWRAAWPPVMLTSTCRHLESLPETLVKTHSCLTLGRGIFLLSVQKTGTKGFNNIYHWWYMLRINISSSRFSIGQITPLRVYLRSIRSVLHSLVIALNAWYWDMYTCCLDMPTDSAILERSRGADQCSGRSECGCRNQDTPLGNLWHHWSQYTQTAVYLLCSIQWQESDFV